MFFDAHLHNINKESGGILVGLEGNPRFKGTLTNKEAIKLSTNNNNYIAFYYVVNNEINKKIEHRYLKYHPRREKYTPEDVIKSIILNKPRSVMIDTLNEPYWQSYDYWKIARLFPNIIFIFPHSGGYLINEFIKIAHFQTNVWIDFSLTHTNLGKFNDKFGLLYIQNAIKYALNSSFKKKILLGSDYPFFSQKDVIRYYNNYINMLNENYIELIEVIKNDTRNK